MGDAGIALACSVYLCSIYAMSKTDQLRAMREARIGRKKPNPFEDAARGRDPVKKGGNHVAEPASHIVKNEPSKVDLGRKRRSAPAPQRPGGEMPGPTLSAPVEQRSARQSHKLEVEGSNPSRATKSIPECPVCAARRTARAAAQKKWRKGRQAEKRSK